MWQGGSAQERGKAPGLLPPEVTGWHRCPLYLCGPHSVILSVTPPLVHLPLKLRPDRLHLPEADPAAVFALDHRHPGGAPLRGCGHQSGGEVRGPAGSVWLGVPCEVEAQAWGTGLLDDGEGLVPAAEPQIPLAWLCPEP